MGSGGARGTRRRDLCRYAEMSEDPLDHGRLFDERDQAQAAAAPRTGQHIKPEGAILILHLPQWN